MLKIVGPVIIVDSYIWDELVKALEQAHRFMGAWIEDHELDQWPGSRKRPFEDLGHLLESLPIRSSGEREFYATNASPPGSHPPRGT